MRISAELTWDIQLNWMENIFARRDLAWGCDNLCQYLVWWEGLLLRCERMTGSSGLPQFDVSIRRLTLNWWKYTSTFCISLGEDFKSCFINFHSLALLCTELCQRWTSLPSSCQLIVNKTKYGIVILLNKLRTLWLSLQDIFNTNRQSGEGKNIWYFLLSLQAIEIESFELDLDLEDELLVGSK